MNIEKLLAHSTFHPISHFYKETQIPNDLLPLLTHAGSLTQLLRQITNHKIKHTMRFAGWGKAIPHEYQKLHRQENDRLWVRETEWIYKGKTLVYTRTIIPTETTQIPIGHEFLNAGHKSLGEILFKDTTMKRSEFEFSEINEAHNFSENLWSRRSVFHIHNKPLLITEIFLPNIYEIV